MDTSLYVLFGMVAGGPIWLLLLILWARPRRSAWRVIDGECKRLDRPEKST